MKSILVVAVLMAPVALSGCVIVDGEFEHFSSDRDWQHSEYKNRKHIARLQPEMTTESVKQKMGTPDFNELYDKGGKKIQVLFYRTHRKEGDGVTTKDECTPLVFENGVLVGWGDTAYSHI